MSKRNVGWSFLFIMISYRPNHSVRNTEPQMLRTCFWYHSRKVGSISEAVQEMLGEGLVRHIQELEDDEVPKVDLWLRAMMHDTIEILLESSADGQED